MVPVNIDTARPEDSSGLMEAVLALRYDPQVFFVSAQDVHLGNLASADSGWRLIAAVNERTGEIGVDLFSIQPIQSRNGGSLITVTMHVRETAPAGSTSLNLVPSVNPTGNREYRTEAADAQGTFVLHPIATDGANDAGVDGRVLVPAPVASGVLATTAQSVYVAAAETVQATGPRTAGTFDVPATANSGKEVADAVLEHIFGDLEPMGLLRSQKEFGEIQTTSVFEEPSSDAAAYELAIGLEEAGGVNNMWTDQTRETAGGRRKGVRSVVADLLESLDDASLSGDQVGLEAFFAGEGAKDRKSKE
jgi:hypothetical protein